MGISETKFTSHTAEFILKNHDDYLSWWNCDDSNQAGSGVSLIMKKHIAQYVQSVKAFKGQLIYNLAKQVSKFTNKLENVKQQQIQLASSFNESPGSTSFTNINENNKRIRTTAPKTQHRSTSMSKNMPQMENIASLDFTISATQASTFSSSFNVFSSPPPVTSQEDYLNKLEASFQQS